MNLAANQTRRQSVNRDFVKRILSNRFAVTRLANSKCSLQCNAGLYLAAGNGQFKFQETVTIPGAGTEVHSGSRSQTDFLIGGYVGASVAYALTEDVALFAGAQFQSAGRPVNKENGKEAIINLDKSVMVSLGASYSF